MLMAAGDEGSKHEKADLLAPLHVDGRSRRPAGVGVGFRAAQLLDAKLAMAPGVAIGYGIGRMFIDMQRNRMPRVRASRRAAIPRSPTRRSRLCVTSLARQQ